MKTQKKVLKKLVKHLQETIYTKCLECSCLNVQEVTDCVITTCPLFLERPIEATGLYTLIKQLRQKNSTSSEAKK